jgi:molecular chaperone HtpG
MRQGQLSIHSENILPIIKKWLYSEKDIFIRELASNASDAIHKRMILHAQGLATAPQEHRIDITINAAAKTITISDTGLGLDETEAEQFLSQIAFSGAEAFIKTYQSNDTFIGHFGLGFFSVFMVATHVEVVSRSYKPDAPAIVWSSDGSSTFSIAEGTRADIGTDVILHLAPDQEEYLDETHLRTLLKRFCGFFPHSVLLNGKKVNEEAPLWLKRPSECTDSEYQQLYRTLYPLEDSPLFWVHLNVDYPFHVQGILYFPKIHKEMERSPDHIKLFCNRVFVSDDCKDILPDYLVWLRGVLDSPDIPLNVSRSHLQVDKTVRQLSHHIAKKVADALSGLFKNDRPRFESCWEACELVVKLGLLQDEKFYPKAKDLLVWKTTDGTWKTTDEVSTERDEKRVVLYCEPEQQKSPLVSAYVAKGSTVVVLTSPVDHPLMTRLERDHMVTFRRVDAAIDPSLLDSTKEKTVLDASGRTEAAKIADFFRSVISVPTLTVEAKSLDVTTIPAIMTLQEDERRFRDYVMRVSGKDGAVTPKASLIINTNSPLVQAAYTAHGSSPKLAAELALHIWDVTRLSHKELSLDEMHVFTERSTRLLEELARAAPLHQGASSS